MYSVNKVNASITVDKLPREMFYSLNWNISNCQWNDRPNKGKLKSIIKNDSIAANQYPSSWMIDWKMSTFKFV